MKTILILGARLQQLPAIKLAKEMGLKVVVIRLTYADKESAVEC